MSTEYRMDGRRPEVFSHNVKDHTTREKIVSQIMRMEFTDAEKEQLLSGNAKQFFGLK